MCRGNTAGKTTAEGVKLKEGKGAGPKERTNVLEHQLIRFCLSMRKTANFMANLSIRLVDPLL